MIFFFFLQFTTMMNAWYQFCVIAIALRIHHHFRQPNRLMHLLKSVKIHCCLKKLDKRNIRPKITGYKNKKKKNTLILKIIIIIKQKKL